MKSLATPVLSLVAVLLFLFTFLFIWNGSDTIALSRVAMEKDKSTQVLLAEQIAKRRAAAKEMEGSYEPAEPVAQAGDGPPVVLWLSIPGFRGDYIEKSETTFFDMMKNEGASTTKMRPAFPCLNFPAHATMATGVLPSKHGVIADRFRQADGSVQVRPTDPSLLKAEPIWNTATRQGIRTLVHGWPLSQNQTGEHAAAHFESSYDMDATDEQRLNAVWELWKSSAGAAAASPAAPDGGGDAAAAAAPASTNHLRLVMIQLTDLLKAGEKNGPRADETYAAVATLDKALSAFIDKIKADWATIAPKDANLVVLVSTDHGMAELDKNVNVQKLLGEEMMANADIIAHDAIANLYFKNLPESDAEKQVFYDKFDDEMSKRLYFRTYTKENLPAEWEYTSENVGDRVLVLKGGYAFSDFEAEEPVFDPAEGPGLFGSFGYPVSESIRMSGQTILWGYPKSPASGDMGEIKQTTFHATVAKILGIEAAAGADAEVLN